MNDVAVVTGASSGVGREFVRQLDAGAGGPLDQIWLVARRRDVLDEVAAGCSTPTRVLVLDLTRREDLDELATALDGEEALRLQWLVNCAGFGKFGDFAARPLGEARDMLLLNCLAPLECSYHALPHMVAGSRIVNLSSIAGVIPQPGLSVYSATKSFVLELSRTLDHELEGTGIHVTAVCPKFMRTGFLDEPGDAGVARGMTRIGFEDVDRVVRRAIAGAIAGRQVVIPSWDMRAAALTARLLPTRAVMRAEGWLLREG